MEIYSERVRGRNKDKETIVRFLTENRSKTAVVTIWGIGGIGKTTLARLVCKDEKVQSHFHPLLWANARHAFHLNTIIEDFLELDHDRRGLLSIGDLKERLKRRIEGRTCLLVLDDVGKLAPEQCQELRDLFEVGIAGILIATLEDQDIDLVNKDEISRKQTFMTIKEKIGSCIDRSGEEVGIEEGKKKIEAFVLKASEDKLSTLFIEGVMDAENDPVQSICNDVKDKFEFFKWVPVPGEEFNLKSIVRCILGEEEQGKTLDQLQIELQKKLLENKRFLIGLDVYGMNAYQCDELEFLLTKNGKVGNKLLIATRDKQVPPIANKKMPRLGSLSMADSLNLVVKNAEFAEIGREIIEGCRGVPLLVRMFGGILSDETDENKLKEIQEKIKNSRPFDVSEILKLSFDTLPPHIKKCFLYSTYFTLHPPERGRLMQQWIALDLVEGSENNQKLEDLAKEYFDELLSKSFFYSLVEDDLMEEARFEVHDLLYKLAHKVSEGEYCITSSDQIEKIDSTVLHLVFTNKSENFPSLRKLKKLRTFKWEKFGLSATTSDTKLRIFKWENFPSLRKLKLRTWESFGLSSATPGTKLDVDILSRSLRVLDLSGSEFEQLPSSIGELRDLRYLDVSYNIYLDELPSALFKLSNLETLRFEECGILELPRDFSKLKKLRNLYACTEQGSIPEEVICGLASLRILHLNPIRNLETLPSLKNLTALETLVLRFCSRLTLLDTDIKGLKSLRNLTITHSKNKESLLIPSSLEDAAASLSSLCLSYCLGMATLPEWLVNLKRLRRLHVEFCPNLSPSPEEKIPLPNCLKYLSIRGCPELTKICESEDWQQKNKGIREIHLDGKIIRSISDTRSSDATSPSSVHVEKDGRGKGKITDVEFSKLPSSNYGPVDEIYEDEAMIQSTPVFESSIPPSSSSEDMFIFDVEEGNPLTTNINDESGGRRTHLFARTGNIIRKMIKGSSTTSGEGIKSRVSKKESELCFQLGSLFPEVSDIPIESIVSYAIGIGLFGDATTMSQVRARVTAALQPLRGEFHFWGFASNAFRMGRRGKKFKFARSAAHEREHKSFIQTGADLNKWPAIDLMDQYTYISLMENHIPELPEVLECPKLQLLSLRGNRELQYIPDSCFRGTTMLRVLDLSRTHLGLTTVKSLECLESLRSLLLDFCKLEGDLSVIGNLSKLEILSLRGSSITELPVEIGRLNELRVLDLENCAKLERIPPKVISKLLKLEELYMKRGFKKWEVLKGGTAVSDDDAGKGNASFSEIQSLSSLAVFSAIVDDVDCLPDDFSFSGNLTKFDLQIGKISSSISLPNQYANITRDPSVNNFFLSGDNNRHTHIQLASSLLPKVGHLVLKHVKMTPILSDSDEKGAFEFVALKSLRLTDCGGLEYLSGRRSTNAAFANLKELRLEKLTSMKGLGEEVPNPGSFQNIRILEIRKCEQLSGVIPSNWIRNFPKLEKLHVGSCSSITEIIGIDEIAKDLKKTPLLANIKKLHLKNLKGLLSICKGPGKFLSFSNLIELHISDCPTLAFIFSPYISQTLFHLQTLSIVGCGNLGVIFKETEEGAATDEIRPLKFLKLNKMTVRQCEELNSVFPISSVRGLVKLKELDISDCKNLTEIFKKTEEGAAKYETLPLELNKMNVHQCDGLESLLPVSIARGLVNLEELNISGCKSLTEIFKRTEDKAAVDEIRPLKFSKLDKMTVRQCDELKSLFPVSIARGLVKLKELDISGCKSLTEILKKTEEGAATDEIRPLEFPELNKMTVRQCEELRSLFSVSVARGLVKLKELDISGCKKLAEIFKKSEEGAATDEIRPLEFPELNKMTVHQCEGLESLLPVSIARGLVKLKELNISGCTKLAEIFKKTEEGAATDEIRPLEFPELNKMTVHQCEGLESLLPVSIARGLVKLKELDISGCTKLAEIFKKTEEGAATDEIRPLEFPELNKMTVHQCEGLESLLPVSIARGLVKLKELDISGCKSLTEICKKTEEGAAKYETLPLEFPELNKMTVRQCEELRSLFSVSVARGLVKLKELDISDCEKLEVLVSGEDSTGTEREANSDEIQLPKLIKTTLRGLIRFEKFCHEDYYLCLPLLQELIYSGIPVGLTWLNAADSFNLKIPRSAKIIYRPKFG